MRDTWPDSSLSSLASVSLLILSSKENSDVAVSRLRRWIPEYHAPAVLAYLVVLNITHSCLVFSQYFASGIIVQKKKTFESEGNDETDLDILRRVYIMRITYECDIR